MFLLVDIGGSKSRLVLSAEDGSIIRETTAPGFGTIDDTEDIHQLLFQVGKAFLAEDVPSAVVVNLGGKNKTQISNTFSTLLPKAKISVFRESEGTVSLAYAAERNASTIMLAGTGVILCGKDAQGKTLIAGGWGANIGDAGSGYDIGLQGIRVSLMELDGKGPLSPMAKEITGRSEPLSSEWDATAVCAARDEVRKHIGGVDRRNIASFAKVVATHCRNQEKEAQVIMHQTGLQLAKQIADFLMKIGDTKNPTVVICGGLCHARDCFQEVFEENLKKQFALITLIYEPDALMSGLFILAKKQIND